jgi:lipopolysaccharide export system permease protein
MKTLKKYITYAFFWTFLSTLAVFTFVLSIGALFKLTPLVARGVSLAPIIRIFFNGMPTALAFAIPISAITATLLVFGRLSADSEITAMRACGISLWQITRWMLPVALLLLLACLYINSELMPQSHYASRTATARLGVINPVDLIEEGRTIREFDGLSLYVERKRGNELEQIRIFDQREQGRTREIKAERAVVSIPTNSNDIVLMLERVTIDPFSFESPGKADAARWPIRIEDARRSAVYRRRNKDLSMIELYTGAKGTREEARKLELQVALLNAEADALNARRTNTVTVIPPAGVSFGNGIETRSDELRVRAMRMMVEFHKRLALSGACFAFVFLGIPLGVRSHRKESSLGIAMSLLAVFVFYMFLLLAEQLADYPKCRPDLLNWIPIVLALAGGIVMIRRLH